VFKVETDPIGFYQNVSPSQELRDASTESESLICDFGVESSMRIDIFKSKAAAEKNIKDSHQWEKLSLEEQRLVAKMVRIIVIFSCHGFDRPTTGLGWNESWTCSSS